MLREWNAAIGGHTRRKQESERALVEAWEDRLATMRARMDELWRAGQWVSGPADLLGVIDRSRHETYHSAILAWLLDPGAPHGLFTTFLESMLRRLWPETSFDASALRGATTQTEVARERCRADIVVQAAGMTIIVEVKVDADERGEQCNDYFRVFSPESRDARFAFLTPDGRAPSTATDEDAANVFRRWSFRQIRDDLRALLADPARATDPAKGLYAVRTYLETLEVEFP